MTKIVKFVFAVVTACLSIGGNVAIAEPITASALKLTGKSQSDCLRSAEAGLNASGMSGVTRGKTQSGQPGNSFFANDKPYYAIVLCEGDVAFIAISGPVSEKRLEIFTHVGRAVRTGGAEKPAQ